MNKFSSRDFRALAIIALGAIVFPVFYSMRELAIAGTLGYPLDDSWIHLVFARTTARGDFFSYNPHTPVAGSTAPLWTLILAIGYFFTHSPVIMPKVIGIALNIALGWSTLRLGEQLGLKRFPAIVTALATVGATRIVWSSLSGMETSLFALLTVLSTLAYLRYAGAVNWRFYAPWVLAALAAWSRPELVMLPVFFVVHQILMRWQRPAAPAKVRTDERRAFPLVPWGKLFLGVAVFGAGMIPFFVLNLELSGSVLPLTFAAKTTQGGVWSLLAEGEYYEVVRRMLLSVFVGTGNSIKWLWSQDNLFLMLESVVGLGWLLVRTARRTVSTTVNAGMLLLGIHLLAYAGVRAVVTGSLDFGQFGRYATQTTPLMLVFGAVFLCSRIESIAKTVTAGRSLLLGVGVLGTVLLAAYYALAPEIGRSHQWPSLDWYLPFLGQGGLIHVLMFAVWALIVIVIAERFFGRQFSVVVVQGLALTLVLGYTVVENIQTATEYAWNVRNIEDTQVALGNWLKANTPAGTVYATNDIGAMAYIADSATIIDVVGLVQPEVGAKLSETKSVDRTALWALQHWKVEYFICFDEWYPLLIRDGVRAGVLERVKSVPIHNNLTCGAQSITAMHVYRVHPDRYPALLGGSEQ